MTGVLSYFVGDPLFRGAASLMCSFLYSVTEVLCEGGGGVTGVVRGFVRGRLSFFAGGRG